MASRRRALVLEIVADTKKSQAAFGRFTQSLKGFAVGLVAAFSFDRLVGGFQAAVGAASNLEESANAVGVRYGAAAKQIEALGKTAADQLGLSRREVNELASAFYGFGEQLQQGPAQAFDQIIKRAADFGSVMNLDVNEAMLKFQSGLAGEVEPLRRFGIDLSAAAVQAHAYAEGIAASGAKLSEQEKVQARYSLLMRETAFAQGDFAATSDDLANASRRASAAWENFTAALGGTALPVAAEGMNFLADTLTSLPARANKVEQVMAKTDSAFARFGNTIGATSDETVDFTVAFEDVERVTGRVLRDIGRGVAPLEAMQVAMARMAVETGTTVTHYDEFAEGIGATAEETLIAATQLDQLNRRTAEYSTTINGVEVELGGMTDAQQRHSELTQQLWDRITLLNEAQGFHGSVLETTGAQYDGYIAAMQAAWEKTAELEEKTYDLGGAMDGLTRGEAVKMRDSTQGLTREQQKLADVTGINARLIGQDSVAAMDRYAGATGRAIEKARTLRSAMFNAKDAIEESNSQLRTAESRSRTVSSLAGTIDDRTRRAATNADRIDREMQNAVRRAERFRWLILNTPSRVGNVPVGGGVSPYAIGPVAPAPSQPIEININTGVGDPVAIGREVAGVLSRYRGAGGRN